MRNFFQSPPSKVPVKMGPAIDGTKWSATPSSLQTLPPSKICDTDWESGQRLAENEVLQSRS